MTEIIVNRFETHDRLQEFGKQKDNITKGILDCIKNRPEQFKNHPFYIYSHVRTADDGHTKRLIWQPRLKKPKAQTNSMLFKAYPPGDKIKVIWMIPDRDQWPAYKKGTMLHQQVVLDSIKAFQEDRLSLEKDEEDEVTEEMAQRIYREIAISHKQKLEKKQADEVARIKAMEIQ